MAPTSLIVVAKTERAGSHSLIGHAGHTSRMGTEMEHREHPMHFGVYGSSSVIGPKLPCRPCRNLRSYRDLSTINVTH